MQQDTPDPHLSSPRRRTVEDMTKEELIQAINKFKNTLQQIKAEKQIAEDLYTQSVNEKKELESKLQSSSDENLLQQLTEEKAKTAQLNSEREGLRTKTIEIIRKCKDLQAKNAELEALTKNSATQNNEIKSQSATTEEDNKVTTQSIIEQRDSLSQENSNLKEIIENMNRSIQDFEVRCSHFQSLQFEIDDYKSKILSNQLELQQMEDKNKLLESQLASHSTSIPFDSNSTSTSNENTNTISILQDRLKQLTEEHEILQKEKEHNKSSIQKAVGMIKSLKEAKEKENIEANDKISKLQSEIFSLKNSSSESLSVDTKDSNLNKSPQSPHVEESLEALKEDNKVLLEQLANERVSIESLRYEMSNIQESYRADIEMAYDKQQAAMDEKSVAIQVITEQNEALSKEIAQLQEELALKNEALSKEIAQLQEELALKASSSTESHQLLLDAHEQLKEELSKVISERDTHKGSVHKAVGMIKELKAKTIELTTHSDELINQISLKDSSIAQLQEERDILQHRIVELQHRIVELQHALESSDINMNRLLIEKDNNYTHVENEKLSLENEINRLSEELISKDKSLNDAMKQIEILDSRISNLVQDNAILESNRLTILSEKETLQETQSSAENTITTLQDKILALEDSLLTNKNMLNDVKNKLLDMEGNFNTLLSQKNDEIIQLSNQYNNKEQEQITIQHQLELQIASLNEIISNQNDTIQNLQSSISSINEMKENENCIQSEITTLQTKITTLESEKLEKDSILIEANKDRDQLKSKLARIVEKLKDHKAQLKKKTEECNEISEKFNSKTEEYNEISEKFISKTEEYNVLSEKLISKSEEYNVLLANIENLEKLKLNTDDILSAITTDKEKLQLEVDRLIQEKDSLLHSQENIQCQLDDSLQTSTVLQQEKERLQNREIELTQQIQNLQENNDSLQKTITEFKNQIVLFEENNNEMKDKIVGLESRLEHSVSGSTDLQEEMQTIINEKEQSKSQLQKAVNMIKTQKTTLNEKEQELTELNERINQYTIEINNYKKQCNEQLNIIESYKQDIEDRDAQLASSLEHINVLDTRLSSTSTACKTMEVDIQRLQVELDTSRKLQDKIQKKEDIPKSFQVLMRCHDGDQVWCLLNTERDNDDEQDGSYFPEGYGEGGCDGGMNLEWRRESLVQCWIDQRVAAAADEGGFSIDSSEIEMPATIQDELRSEFESESLKLRETISALQQELEGNRQAFDKYRDRARASLKKSSSEQHVAESRILEVQERLKIEIEKASQAEAHTKHLEAKQKEALNEIRNSLYKEKEEAIRIKSEFNAVRLQLIEFDDESKNRIIAVQNEINQKQDSNKDALVQLGELQVEVETLRAKEKHLLSEMKKRGDIARQMCNAKDEEIRVLREKVHFDQRKSTPGNTPRAGSGAGSTSPRSTNSNSNNTEIHSATHIPSGIAATSSSHVSVPGALRPGSLDMNYHNHNHSSTSSSPGTGAGVNLNHLMIQVPHHNHTQGTGTGGGGGGGGGSNTTMYSTPTRSTSQSRNTNNERIVEKGVGLEGDGEGEGDVVNEEEGDTEDQIVAIARVQASRERDATRLRLLSEDSSAELTNLRAELTTREKAIIDLKNEMKRLRTRANSAVHGDDPDNEREQKITYLKSAFCGFVLAKKSVEMQNLGRVICAILGLEPEEHARVTEAITKLTPAAAATSSMVESFSTNFVSFFDASPAKPPLRK
eukprot:gene3557-7077_t